MTTVDVLGALRTSQTGEDIVAACRSAETQTLSNALETLEGMIGAATSQGDQQSERELRSDRAILQFVAEHGVERLEDLLVVRLSEDLAEQNQTVEALLEGNVSEDSMRLTQAIDGLVALTHHADFANASAAYRMRARRALATLMSDRYELTGEPSDLDSAIAEFAMCSTLVTPLSPEDYGSLLNKLAIAYLRRYEHGASAEDLDAAIRYLEQALGQDDVWSGSANALTNLGIALRRRGLLRRSLNDLDRAIEVFGRSNEHGRASAVANLANGHRSRFLVTRNIADLDQGIEYLKAALLATQTGSLEHVRISTELGSARLQRNQLRRNPEDLAGALEVLRDAVHYAPPGSLHERRAVRSLADAHEARYHYQDDLKDLNAMYDLRKRLYETSDPGSNECAQSALSLGRTWFFNFKRTHQEQSARKAEELLQLAADTAQEKDTYYVAALDSLARLAHAELSQRPEDPALGERALMWARRATDVVVGLHETRESFDLLADVAMAIAVHQANTLGDQTQHELWNVAAEASLKANLASIGLAEAQTGELRMLLSLRNTQGSATRAAYACVKAGRLADAVEVLEAGRGILLARGLSTIHAQLQPLLELGDVLAQRYLELEGELADIESSVALLRGMGGDAGRDAWQTWQSLEEQERRRHKLQVERSGTLAALRARPELSGFMTPPSFNSVQAFAREHDTAILYLAAFEHETMVLVVRPSGTEVKWLKVNATDIQKLLFERKSELELTDDERVELYADQVGWVEYATPRATLGLDSCLSPFGNWTDRKHKTVGARGGLLAAQMGLVPLRAVVAEIVAEIVSHFSALRAIEEQSLLLVPYGDLALLPIHAALPGRVVRHAVSVSTLGKRPPTNGLNGPLCAIGDPQPTTPRLSWARLEAQAALAAVGQGQALIGYQATRENVLEGLQDSEALHLACHAESNADDPLESRLLLAQGTTLTAAEIRGLSLGSLRLVVLSGCLTARADARYVPDETLSIATAFLHAGVPSVIGSQWQVDDESTAHIMDHFYRACKAGRSPAQALQLATSIVAEDQLLPFSHPMHWSPFVLYGW